MSAEGKITASAIAKALAKESGAPKPRILVTRDRSKGIATYRTPDGALFASRVITDAFIGRVVDCAPVAPRAHERSSRWNFVVELSDGSTDVIRGLAPSQTIRLAPVAP